MWRCLHTQQRSCKCIKYDLLKIYYILIVSRFYRIREYCCVDGIFCTFYNHDSFAYNKNVQRKPNVKFRSLLSFQTIRQLINL